MDFNDYLKRHTLLLDGAMGTMLQTSCALSPGEAPEALLMRRPDEILKVQRAYAEAGCEMLLAVTFSANEKKLAPLGFTPEQVIKKAVQTARQAGAPYVALDVGPIGEMLQPAGTLPFQKAYDIFARQIKAGVQEGVDAIYIETFSDLLEAKAAVLAAKEHSSLPVFCTMTFEETGRTFLGVTPECAALTLSGLGVTALGVNCSTGPDKIAAILTSMRRVTDLPLIAKPNAGLPSDDFQYSVEDEAFAETLLSYLPLGLHLFGGCCGTTPETIKKLRARLPHETQDYLKPAPVPAVCSGMKYVELNRPLAVGERINPTGKKRFQQALLERDISYILKQGVTQSDAGADILDVNVGYPGVDEKEMMGKVVTQLQGVTDLPLQLDSSNPEVLEAALREYNGVPIINSVNGEEKSLESVLPLAQKYGAMVVALTLDENGIPETAQGRLKIAEKIVSRAAQYGIGRHRIAVDCLTLTVSADEKAPETTLAALRLVRERLQTPTALGVSNISFGLPQREKVNAHFLSLALREGLSLAILNPNSQPMMDALSIHLLLHGQDPGGQRYIAQCQAEAPVSAPESPKETGGVKGAILKGLSEEVREETKALLAKLPPLDVVSEHLIPALDAVGEQYEKGVLFLPQLIRSAEAAKGGFDLVRQEIARAGETETPGKRIVLATVKGDIHDIGKNIVRVVLANYGYAIRDLGRDVPPDEVLKAVEETGAGLVGLSALMTTTLPAMAETIRLLKENGYTGKVMVGGAVLTAEYAERIGADYYAKDAKASADIAKKAL